MHQQEPELLTRIPGRHRDPKEIRLQAQRGPNILRQNDRGINQRLQEGHLLGQPHHFHALLVKSPERGPHVNHTIRPAK